MQITTMAIRDLLRPPPQIWVRQGAEVIDTTPFWEERARRFAGEGEGLRAVCSFAMPGFYNWAIDVTQRSALGSLIGSISSDARVLDYGCGVGRWTRRIAQRGARVTGVDFCKTML